MLKENKFLIGLGAITAVVSGGLIFAGLKSSSSLEELQIEIASKKASLNQMQRLNPYPTPASAKAKSESLTEVIRKAEEAREKLLAFKPKEMNDIPVSEFSESLKASVARVRALFPDENALPKGFTLGFKSYADYLPPEEATGELAYQLGAMEYLFTQLSEAGVKEVRNLFREELPMEDGKDWSGAPLKGNGRANPKPKSVRSRRSAKRGEVLPEIARRMPLELTFKGSEEVVREFLTRIGDSEKYFFQTRVGRIVNRSPIPSSGKAGATTTSKSSTDDVASDIVVEPEDDIIVQGDAPPAEEDVAVVKPAESVKILNKISGNEDLEVFLSFDLLVFIESQQFSQPK